MDSEILELHRNILQNLEEDIPVPIAEYRREN